MAEDWNKGDLALCVDDTPNRVWGKSDLRLGRVYVVTHTTWVDGLQGLFLDTARSQATHGFRSSRFIKVTPQEEDEFDRETIEMEKQREGEIA